MFIDEAKFQLQSKLGIYTLSNSALPNSLLNKFNQFFNSEWDSSQYAGPEVALPFEDVYSTEGQRFNYEKWKNKKVCTFHKY